MSRKYPTNDGDWVCSDPNCGNVNFSRRHQCNRCGAEKSHITIKSGGTAIGKQLAEKSKGLFSADDWQCKTCGNVNWARRTDCNLCKTPKFGKVEARTGYGGGYNERQGVEYKSDKEDSDGEFDDFGRKKKKFRGNVPERPKPLQSQQEKEDDEESGDDADLDAYKLESDEEEDDDDDDGDLSKYDLGGDDDEIIPTKQTTDKIAEKTSHDETSRTRSPSRGSRRSSSSASSSSSSKSSRSRSSSRSSSSRSRSRSRSRSHDRKYRRHDSGSDSRHSSSPERKRHRDSRSSSRERSDHYKKRRHRSHSP